MKQKSLKLETVGSTGEIYELNLFKEFGQIRFTCTCPNGAFDDTSYCKHRKAVINGDLTRFLNAPEDSQEISEHLLSQAKWLETHKQIVLMEEELARETAIRKRAIKKAKREVASAMNGRFNPN